MSALAVIQPSGVVPPPSVSPHHIGALRCGDEEVIFDFSPEALGSCFPGTVVVASLVHQPGPFVGVLAQWRGGTAWVYWPDKKNFMGATNFEAQVALIGKVIERA